MLQESLNLCSFADIDSSQASGSSARRREAPLKGAHKGEVVAIRYRWPLNAEGVRQLCPTRSMIDDD
jgi:hypothetical protein